MSGAAERNRLLEARAQVRALRTEVCELETLADEPPSAESAGLVGEKVKKVCATNVATSKSLQVQQPKSARAGPMPLTQQSTGPHSRGAPAPPPRHRSIGTGPADEDVIVASHVQQLVAEGWTGDAALAAVQAVDGASIGKAREWLKSHQCGSGAKTARALRTQRDSEVAPAPRQPAGPPPSYRQAPSLVRGLDKSTLADQAPPSRPANVSAPTATRAEEASDATVRAVAPSEPPSVSIKVRNLQGQVQEITQLFHPSDTLRDVLFAYERQFPLPKVPAVASTQLQFVVPLERSTYTFDAMRTVTLVTAKLCPRATVVLQVKKK